MAKIKRGSVLSCESEAIDLQTIKTDSRIVKGIETTVGVTDVGFDIQRALKSGAGIASANHSASAFVSVFHLLRYVNFIYWFAQFIAVGAALCADLYHTRTQRKTIGTKAWLWQALSKNGRIHTLINAAVWGALGAASFVMAAPVLFAVMVAGLIFDMGHMLWIGLRQVRATTAAIYEQKAELDELLVRQSEGENVSTELKKTRQALADLHKQRQQQTIIGCVIKPAVMGVMLAGWVVLTLANPLLGAVLMTASLVSLIIVMKYGPRIVHFFKRKFARKQESMPEYRLMEELDADEEHELSMRRTQSADAALLTERKHTDVRPRSISAPTTVHHSRGSAHFFKSAANQQDHNVLHSPVGVIDKDDFVMRAVAVSPS